MGFIKGVFKIAIGIVLAIVIIAVIVGAAANSKGGKDAVQKIEDDVAGDAVKQYEIAKKNGSKIDACVQAGFVSAAYLQAKRESDYAHWKQVEKTDCAAAGVPR